MKLANIYWMNTELSNKVKAVNLGDILQLEIIDNLYSQFFNTEKVVKLTTKEVSTYRGEKLILPLNWSLFDSNYMDGKQINISQDIIPVFLAMTIETGSYKDEYINEYNIDYLKKYEPIGCRDEKTRQMLINNGIRAYLNGCLTITIKKQNKIGDKIIFVDVPIEVSKYLPKWEEKIEIFTQQQYFDENCSINQIREYVKSRYEYYFSEAKLIVTSRLHVASPCRAAGIPVIFVKNVIDDRLPWLRIYTPLYNKTEYSSIDWNPIQCDYEEKKQIILKNAVNRIRQAMGEKTNEDYTEQVDELYDNLTGGQSSFQSTVFNNFDKIIHFLNNKYQWEDEFEYAIWGAGQAAENVYKYIQLKYKRAVLTSVIDMYRRGNFHGRKIVSLEEYRRYKNEIMLVVPVQASNMAQPILEQMGFTKSEYICAGELFISSNDLIGKFSQ